MTKKCETPDVRIEIVTPKTSRRRKERFLASHGHELRYEFKRAGTRAKGGGRSLFPKVPKR